MANNNESVQKGQCMNFGNCKKANAKEKIEVNPGNDFICPECESGLIEIKASSANTALKWLIITAIFGLCGYFIVSDGIPFIKRLFSHEDNMKVEQKKEAWYPIIPEDISLDQTVLTFESENESEKLTATIYPDSVMPKNKKIFWRSSNKSVATIDDNGTVTAIAIGKAIISVYTVNGLSANCHVKVGNIIDVTDVEIDKTTLLLSENESEKLSAIVKPEDATIVNVTWSSSDTLVATVDENGIVTAVSIGFASISVISQDGGKIASCELEVQEVNSLVGDSKKSENSQNRSTNAPVSSGAVSVAGGSYSGELRSGQPHGMGTIRYNSRILIDSRDTKKRFAESGQSLTGQFRDGRLLQGRLFDRNGNQIETIIIGGGAY